MKKIISPYVFPGLREVEDKLQKELLFARNKDKKMGKEEILKIISDEFNVTMDDILSKSRKKEIVNARYVYFAALKIKLNISLVEIGNMVGSRDHTSVIHGLYSFKDRYDIEVQFKKSVNKTFKMLDISYNGEKLTMQTK